MSKEQEAYDHITDEIKSLKDKYPSLRTRADDYVFSALCVKSHFYKDPAQVLNDSDFADIIVDGKSDGGADILLTDPNSESSDLVIGQAKFHKTISYEDVLNAMRKMADFYRNMREGHYEQVNARVQSRFLTLEGIMSEDAKFHFVFYTSAPKNKIRVKQIEKKFRKEIRDSCEIDSDKIEVTLMFAADIEDEIKEANSTKKIVEYGKIRIDSKDNYLLYGDDAAIVNVSAFSLKQLYAKHSINLLARNLRYYVKGKNEKRVDDGISDTIENNPASFWLKNNGITIICDNFDIDGVEVKLWNFSIINGGQTTYLLHKSDIIDAKHDLWLPCKIIKIVGENEHEKKEFSLSIAKAANSQKPINDEDLRANSSEQIRFAKVMLAVGVFYQNKRGEPFESKYRAAYLHTKLANVGKLCLAAIFQMPCKSRTDSKSYYKENYYDVIFNGNQEQIAVISKELLYIDWYFSKKFLPEFTRNNEQTLNSSARIEFARLAGRICVAFVALAARYHQGNITDKDLASLTDENSCSNAYKMLCDLGEMKFLLPIELYADAYNEALDKFFTAIIDAGAATYSIAHQLKPALTATNYVKTDANYYNILKINWASLKLKIKEIFSEAQNAN